MPSVSDPIEDPAVAVLLEALPDLHAAYAAMLEVDEDPSAQVVLNELAWRAAELLRSGSDEDEIERIFAAVERVTSTPGVAVESVAFGFLEALPKELGQRASAYCGPATERLWQRLDDGELETDEELWLLEDDDDDDDGEGDDWDDGEPPPLPGTSAS